MCVLYSNKMPQLLRFWLIAQRLQAATRIHHPTLTRTFQTMTIKKFYYSDVTAILIPAN
jgi:hypothetical protein